MKIPSMFRYLSGLVVLALTLSMGSSTSSAQSADSTLISDLLSQAKTHAALAKNDASTLESYARSKMSWRSQSRQIEKIRTHVNQLGALNKELSDARSQGSPWQQHAIDQVDGRLREMADLLTQTIDHMNDNQNRVHMPPFRDYAKANYALASKLADMIRDFVDYDQSKSVAVALEQKLEIPVTQASN
jgi:hypothetical protein